MKNIIIITFAQLGFALNAQSGFVATGGNTVDIGGSASFTMALLDYQFVNRASGSSSEGIQHIFIKKPILRIFSMQNDGVLIYPNPLFDNLNVFVPNTLDIILNYELYSMLGQRIKSGQFTKGENKINVQNLTTGHYLLKLQKEGNEVIVQNLFKN